MAGDDVRGGTVALTNVGVILATVADDCVEFRIGVLIAPRAVCILVTVVWHLGKYDTGVRGLETVIDVCVIDRAGTVCIVRLLVSTMKYNFNY